MFKTIQYETIKATLQKEKSVKLEDIQKAIKVAAYMAVIQSNGTTQKFQLIESKFVKYYELDKLFKDKDVDYIFELALDSDDFINEIDQLTLKDIQSYYLAFVLNVKDADLKSMLIDLLNELSTINAEANDDELIAQYTYSHLLKSELNFNAYEDVLKKIDEYRSNYIYARNSKLSQGFNKKLKKALATYAYGLVADDVIALYDSTIFGGADEGFLITKLGIITTQDEYLSVIPFASIYTVTYDKEAMRFFYKIENDEDPVQVGCLPRIDNLRILSSILAQIAEINRELDKEEGAA